MTDDELEEGLRICEAATPGPWKWTPPHLLASMDEELETLIGSTGVVCTFGVDVAYQNWPGDPPNEADKTFIAYARTAGMTEITGKVHVIGESSNNDEDDDEKRQYQFHGCPSGAMCL